MATARDVTGERNPRGRPREFAVADALDRALPIFWRDGYDGASVSELAEAMGISKPSLYAAFGDKEGLYLQALSRYGEQQEARRRHVLDAQPDARLAVEAFLLSVVATYTDPALPGGCMVVSGASTCDGAAVPESVKQALCSALQVGATLDREPAVAGAPRRGAPLRRRRRRIGDLLQHRDRRTRRAGQGGSLARGASCGCARGDARVAGRHARQRNSYRRAANKRIRRGS